MNLRFLRASSRRGKVLLAGLVVGAVAAGVAGARLGAQPTAGPHGDGTAITPIGWRITPAGRQIQLVSGSVYADRPYAVTQSPDGKKLLISSNGQSTQSLMLVDEASGAIEQAIPYGSPEALFIGVVYSTDGKKVYASVGGNNKIRVFDVAADGRLTETAPIVLPPGIVRPFGDRGPFPAGLAISADGKSLYVANNIDNTMSIVDTATGTVRGSTPVGANPYTVVLSLDGKTAYVSNWGESSVSAVDAATGSTKGTIAVGTHPSAMAVNPATGDLYVANTDGDSVSVIDTASNAVVRAIDLRPYPSAPVGTNPDALASTPNGKTLFVANSGNNDVDVIDLAKANGLNGRDPILGSIPTGWYPTGLVVSQDSSHLFVVNGKGLGAGPNPQGRPRITGRRPTSTPAR